MGTTVKEITYRCDEDCERSGCPSHKMRLSFQSTSNMYVLNIGDGGYDKDIYFDISSAEAMLKLFKEFARDRADTAKMPT